MPPSTNEMAGWYDIRFFFIPENLSLKSPARSLVPAGGPSVHPGKQGVARKGATLLPLPSRPSH